MGSRPLPRLSLEGQPPFSITVGVTLLFAVSSGSMLLALAWMGGLPQRSFIPAAGAWAIATAATAWLTYAIGGALWGPYSWLHRAIEMLSEGRFDFPQEPKRDLDMMKGFRQIAEELKRYRGLKIDALILEKSELEAVINSMTEGLVIYDMEFVPVMTNPALRQMAQPGTHKTAFLDSTTLFLDRWAHPDQVHAIEDAMRQAPDRPRTDLVELVNPRQYLKRYSSPLYNSERKQIGHLVIYHDITPEMEADRLKSEFIANASHELRTPVTSLKVLVESLLDGAQDDAEMRRTFLDDIHTEINRLHTLVNDLLDLAALEGRQNLKIQELDASRVIEEAIATVMPQAKQREVVLEMTVPQAKLPVQADRVRLRQILVNLLANGVKFTPAGGRVTVTAEPGPQGLCFRIADTGIGIPSKDLPHIFDRFFRVTRGRSRLQGGSGLGLTIVKQAIDAHDGEISVESTEGEGTTFVFRIPKA